jgi:hypothetical protein
MNEYTLVFARTRRRQKNNNKRNGGLLREDKTHTHKKKKENEPLPKTHQFGVDGERDRGLSRGSFRDRFRQPVVSHARAMMMMMMIKEVGRSDFVAVVRRRHQSFLLLG